MTDIVDMRKLMETVVGDERQSIDEAGGIIDKTLAKLGSKKAAGKVTRKKEMTNVADGWKTYQGEQGVKKDDPEAFKEFLAYWNFDGDEIDQIMTEPFDLKASLDIAGGIQTKSGKGPTGPERGGPFTNKKPSGDDYNSIMTHYLKTLGGDISILKAEMIQAGKNPKNLDDLSMIGWAWMQANGKDSGNIKAGKK